MKLEVFIVEDHGADVQHVYTSESGARKRLAFVESIGSEGVLLRAVITESEVLERVNKPEAAIAEVV